MVIGKRRQDQILNISSIHKMTANTKVNAVVVVVVVVFFHHVILIRSSPLELHFYQVKLGFSGVYIFFLVFARSIHVFWFLVGGDSNKFP